MKNHCLLIFLLLNFSSPSSVKAQKIIKIPTQPLMVFRVGIGGHQLLGNSPLGGNISFNCEDRVGKHLSWTANFVAMMNPIDLSLPPDVRGSYQTRLIIQPDFRYYPTEALHHFYIGGGLGIVGGHEKITGISPYGKSQLHIFCEALTDIKIGWQGSLFDRYVWNAFTASGLLLPLNGEKTLPILRFGIQLGLVK